MITRLLSYAWPLAAALGVSMLGVIAVQSYTIRGLKLEAAQSLAKAVQDARTKEQEWAIIYQETTHAKDTELRSVAAERDRALASLRNRPRDRLPETPASCAGASPASLASEDAAVVIGFAAEFDELRANYADCKVKLEAR